MSLHLLNTFNTCTQPCHGGAHRGNTSHSGPPCVVVFFASLNATRTPFVLLLSPQQQPGTKSQSTQSCSEARAGSSRRSSLSFISATIKDLLPSLNFKDTKSLCSLSRGPFEKMSILHLPCVLCPASAVGPEPLRLMS
jgi:hypothetical protein